MSIDADQDRQWHTRLHDDIDPAFHKLVDIGIERSEHAFDILLAEFLQTHWDHHQHHIGRRDAIEFVGSVIDDRQRLERADLHPRHEFFEHRLLPLQAYVATPAVRRLSHIITTPSTVTPIANSTASAASSVTSPLFHKSRMTTASTGLPGPASRIASDRSRMVWRNT